MSDLVQRLRDSATQARAIDRAALLHAAADEIERYRSYERNDGQRGDSDTAGAALTDAEREAVETAVEYVGSYYQVEHHAAVLRGLLERTR